MSQTKSLSKNFNSKLKFFAELRKDFPILQRKIMSIENRKAYIGIKDSNTILSPQYDLLRGNAGHPFYSCSGGFI